MIEIIAKDNDIIPYMKIRGIYWLLKYNEIVYVGQSENIYKRVYQHNDKEFDSWSYKEVLEENLNELESNLIIKIRPKLNKTIPQNEKFISVDSIKISYKLTLSNVKKIIKDNTLKTFCFNKTTYVDKNITKHINTKEKQ